jgi:hypothetical protein
MEEVPMHAHDPHQQQAVPARNRAARPGAATAAPEPVNAERVGPAAAGPGGPSVADVLALQRSAGNAAAAQFVSLAQQAEQDAGPAVQRSSVPEVLRSPGRPLDPPVRADMEARLGADFSAVRVHTGGAAARSAEEVGARAYTSGDHVVLGRGGADRHTLAHELTHVIQQRSGPVAGTDHGDGLQVSDPSDPFERAAEDNAARALAGPVPVASEQPAAGNAAALQRTAGNAGTVATPTSVPLQRAGGHGGLEFRDERRTIQKPTNAAEEKFYADRRTDASDTITGVIPDSYSGDEVAQLEAQHGITPPAPGGEPGHEVFIENIAANMKNPQLLDIKIGARTASKAELRSGGMSVAAAWYKKSKMMFSDVVTGSASRGYRVVDAPGMEESRMQAGRHSASHIQNFIPRDPAEVWNTHRDRIVEDLRAVLDAARNSQFTFIAASVLIAVGQEPATELPLTRVTLIDFAHPIPRGEDDAANAQFAKYHQRFINGLDRLITEFEGLQPPSGT